MMASSESGCGKLSSCCAGCASCAGCAGVSVIDTVTTHMHTNMPPKLASSNVRRPRRSTSQTCTLTDSKYLLMTTCFINWGKFFGPLILYRSNVVPITYAPHANGAAEFTITKYITGSCKIRENWRNWKTHGFRMFEFSCLSNILVHWKVSNLLR